MDEIKSKIRDYLISNRDHVLKLIEPYTKQREELLSNPDKEFKNDVEQQFLFLVRSIIVQDVCKNAQVDAENAIIVVNAIDLLYYIQVDII